MENFLIDVDKLQEICKFYKLNFAKFAEKIGISANESLTAICKGCPEISPYWLITGEGSMLGGQFRSYAILERLYPIPNGLAIKF